MPVDVIEWIERLGVPISLIIFGLLAVRYIGIRLLDPENGIITGAAKAHMAALAKIVESVDKQKEYAAEQTLAMRVLTDHTNQQTVIQKDTAEQIRELIKMHEQYQGPENPFTTILTNRALDKMADALLSLAKGDTKKAEEYVEEIHQILRKRKDHDGGHMFQP